MTTKGNPLPSLYAAYRAVQLKELSLIVSKYHIGCGLPKECNSECDKCAAEAIYKAGYRRINPHINFQKGVK